MKPMNQTFRNEAALARQARTILRREILAPEHDMDAQYEVRGTGSIPDVVLYQKVGDVIHYVITLELKLRDWRKAVAQAFRHRNFGNEAYVVLDRAKADSALENLEIFVQFNIGLATLARQGYAKIWHHPKPDLPFSSQFACLFARNLLKSDLHSCCRMPFIRTVRGGAKLYHLRSAFLF